MYVYMLGIFTGCLVPLICPVIYQDPGYFNHYHFMIYADIWQVEASFITRLFQNFHKNIKINVIILFKILLEFTKIMWTVILRENWPLYDIESFYTGPFFLKPSLHLCIDISIFFTFIHRYFTILIAIINQVFSFMIFSHWLLFKIGEHIYFHLIYIELSEIIFRLLSLFRC